MDTLPKVASGGLLLAYVGLVVLVPPYWVPWSSPVSLFGILFVFVGAALLAVCFGARVALEVALTRQSERARIAVSALGPVVAVVPVYGYLVFGGGGLFPPLASFLFALGVVAGLITVPFSLKYP